MRHRGATIGLVAAVATVALIFYRLLNATGPVPTNVVLSSQASTPLSVSSLQFGDQVVLSEGWTPAATGAAGPGLPGMTQPQAVVGLSVGRPSQVVANLSMPAATVVTCTLEPRPHGACSVHLRFLSATELQCSFDCKTPARAE